MLEGGRRPPPTASPTQRAAVGKEEQGSGRGFPREGETELSGLCGDVPAGTPVNAHVPAGRVERSEPSFDPFRSAFPSRRVGNETACEHARKPYGLSKTL